MHVSLPGPGELSYRNIPNNSRGVYLFQSLNRPGVYLGPGGNLGQAFNSFLSKIWDENVTNFAGRESSCPFASPIWLVKKKHGSLRLCVDYTVLHSKTTGMHLPFPILKSPLMPCLGHAVSQPSTWLLDTTKYQSQT